MDKNDIPRWQPGTDPNLSTEKRNDSNKKIVVFATAAAMAAVIIAVILIVSLGNEKSKTGGQSDTADFNDSALSDDEEGIILNLADTSGMTKEVSSSGSGYILTDVSAVVEELLPSVVSITSKTIVDESDLYEKSRDFLLPWGFYPDDSGFSGNVTEKNTDDDADVSKKEVENGIGSGTIIAQNSSELLILTSYHVVKDAASISVMFINDDSADGYIKSVDKEKDIAIAAVSLDSISAETRNTIKIAALSNRKVEVGEGVIVIGNALGYGISVTTGIVSAVDREITVDGTTIRTIQTDAAINSGNSGGCMLNSNGEIIGINEAKISLDNVEGMCYAIPIAENLDLIQNLLNAEENYSDELTETNTSDSSAYLGIRGRDITSDIANAYNMPQGIYVSSTIRGSGASEAGLKCGDIIVGIDDVVVLTMSELQEEIKKHNAGDIVTLVVNRKNNNSYSSVTIDVTLSERK